MNKLFTSHLLLVVKEDWEYGTQQRAWQQLTSLAVRNSLHSIPNIALTLDI